MPDDPVLDEPVASSRVPQRPAPPLDAGAWERCGAPYALRPSQDDALERVGGATTYVVLPPGTGKTLVGLEAVRRLGRRALVLVPSTAVQAQWLTAWDGFGGAGAHPLPGGTSPDLRSAVTVLTYQALSAWDRGADDQEVEDSTDGALAERRRAAVRGLDGADLLSLLHPSGRALVDRAAGLGPWTLVVDECAHLLDTWGSLVPAVAEALGDETVVVGLTATPADGLSEKARAVRDRLFPGPDVEVALPGAVVRGELALVRDLVHVVRPTPEEDAVLAGDRGRFGELRDELLRARAGSLPFAEWLWRRLHERRSDGERSSWRALQRAEPALARAGLRMVSAGLVDLPSGAVLREQHRAPADAQDWAVLLGAYAQEHLQASRSPEDVRLLDAVGRVLPSLGWTLTGRGLRATTSPFDRVCAASAAKAAGARRVLAHELSVRRDGLRSLVVCGADARAVQDPRSRRDGAVPAAGSAAAVFVELATSEVAAGLRPVLCTGRTVAMRREDLADFRAFAPHRLADRLVAEPFAGQRSLVRLCAGDDWTAATWVPLVRDWLASGGTAAVVGTRGLLGEGWDSPSLNVVVDLTASGSPAVATAVRGRVLRRDPDRPQEVVHAWTVTCVADDHPRGGVDHLRTVGATALSLGLGQDGLVEAGVGHLDPELGPDAAPAPSTREAVNARALDLAAAHGSTREGWAAQGPGVARAVLRVRAGRPLGMPAGVVPPSLLQVTRTLGSPAPAPVPRTPRRVRLWPLPVAAGVAASATGTALESALVGAGGGLATGVVLGGAVAGQRWVAQSRALRAAPADASSAVLRQLADAVADALHAAGGTPVGASAVRSAGRRDGEVELGLAAEPEAAALFATCLEELLLPLGEPRWLVSRLVLLPPDGPGAARRLSAARAVGRPVEAAVTWHAVPTWLARNRSGVDAFDSAWKTHVGAGRLVLATDPEGRSIVELLRGEDPFAVRARVRTVWTSP